jgi:hypothetical protein
MFLPQRPEEKLLDEIFPFVSMKTVLHKEKIKN